MSLFFQIYNLFSALIYSISIGGCFFAWGRLKRKDYMYAGFMMLVCIFDSVYLITQELLGIGNSTHALFLTASLAILIMKLYLINSILSTAFNKKVSSEFYILLCIIVIIHGVLSTYPPESYRHMSPVCFYIGILIICNYYWYYMVQETDDTVIEYASRYKDIVFMFMVSSVMVLFYMVSSMSLMKNDLSQSYIDRYSNVLPLIMAGWYIVFLYSELRAATAEEKGVCIGDIFCQTAISDQFSHETDISQQYREFLQEYDLTEREHEILTLVLAGKNNQEISEQLYIAVGTVKTHIHSIFNKLEVSSRGQLMTRFISYSSEHEELPVISNRR